LIGNKLKFSPRSRLIKQHLHVIAIQIFI